MPAIHNRPSDLFDQVSGELNRLFSPRRAAQPPRDAGADWVPRVDVQRNDEQFVIRADLPGVDPRDIDIQLEKGVLSIQGERTGDDSGAWKRAERPRGRFLRRFSLPDSADAEQIQARSRNGVLEIVIPRQARQRRRSIAVEETAA